VATASIASPIGFIGKYFPTEKHPTQNQRPRIAFQGTGPARAGVQACAAALDERFCELEIGVN